VGKLKILVTGKDGQLGYALQELSKNQFEFSRQKYQKMKIIEFGQFLARNFKF